VISNLLTTKLYTPAPRKNFIDRRRILERLDEALTHKLTLIAAPPGYGKTTLLSIWNRERDLPVAWLSLDGEDNDPFLFLRYLIVALQTIDPQVGNDSLSLLKSPQLSSYKAILSGLINDLAAIEQDFALILDDYHWIEQQEVHGSLTYLIDHLPSQMHLIISTRSDPPLPLSRLRARNQLLEIRQPDLRMTTSESAEFMSSSMGLNLSTNQVEILEMRTEGWIAGLQLAALSIQGKEDIDAFIESFGGSYRYVIDYLADEVLSEQPAEVQAFLHQTAILDRLTAELCDAVTGREDSKEILPLLEENNLFLLPLDEQREWYRFHHLFLDYLRASLENELQAALHEKASQWYLTNRLYPEAIKHALACGDNHTAMLAISDAALQSFNQGAISTLSNWLDSLPEDKLLQNSQLATYKGLITFITQSPGKALPYSKAAQENLPEYASSSLQGQLMSLQAHLALYQGDLSSGIQLSKDALEFLDDNDLFFRNLTLNVLGQILEMKGDVVSASDIYRQAFISGQQADDQLGVLVVLTNLVFSLNELGKRNQALTYCQSMIAESQESMAAGLRLSDGVYLPWSLLSLEANQLDLAQEQVRRALEGLDRVNVAQGKLWGQYILARVHLANREFESMEKITSEGRRLAARIGSREIHATWFEALEAQANLVRGDLAAVERWAKAKKYTPKDTPHHWFEQQYFTYTRLLLAQHRWGESQTLLNSMETSAHDGQRLRKLITIYLLQACTESGMGNESALMNRLESAVKIAAPQDYLRAFLDEGQAILKYLPDVHHTAPKFVDELLRSTSPDLQPPTLVDYPYDRLSERELEVLRLVAKGLSNRQIADALFVTLGTVKKHLNNIFGKLQVKNRTQAVARSRELNLLD
jgi:LuxR family maltose regulon positive regulatory protein